MTELKRTRKRDPDRREKILHAAADLVGERGFHAVSLADIGAAADIVGSGVYRHFDNKAAVLVALFDEVIDALSTRAEAAVESSDSQQAALDRLVDGHVAFALEQRRLLQVYHQEFRNIPDQDRVRLQRKQRLYLEEWVHILSSIRPELNDAEARVLVHAAIGAIHSVLFFTSGLEAEALDALLSSTARACLGAQSG